LFHARRDRVAEKAWKWQESHMADQPQSRGAGIFIVLGIAIGTAIGAARHQPSAGLLIGLAAGSLVALLSWLQDRKRIGR
jgi:UDP-N-acetylmuramyl pentapeptide phosphotransferase/UDP-N-acetylglucosamine-1-phosphate transferase